MVNDLLVGFKYHADVLWHLESTGQYGDVKGTTADFVIATEESHGVLATAALRDKDSACAALLMAELALHLKRQKRTIPRNLIELPAGRLARFEATGAVLAFLEVRQTATPSGPVYRTRTARHRRRHRRRNRRPQRLFNGSGR